MMLTYLFKNLVISGIVAALYFAWLQHVKQLVYNRWFLLVGVAISIVAPFCFYTVTNIVYVSEPVIQENMNAIVQQIIEKSVTQNNISPTNNSVNYLNIIYSMYAIVTTILVIKFFRNLYSMWLIIKLNEIQNKNGHFYVLTNKNIQPFAFGKYIFVNKIQFLENSIEPEILLHEQAHANQQHTLDVVCIIFIRTIFWFKPFYYLLQKAIALNHELLADEAALQQTSVNSYQQLLLQQIQKIQQPFSSSFNFMLTKKRFQMMHQKTPSLLKSFIVNVSTITMLVGMFYVGITQKAISQTVPFTVNKKNDLQKDTILKLVNSKNSKQQLHPFDEATASAELKEYLSIVRKFRTITPNANGDTLFEYKIPYAVRVELTKIYQKISKEERRHLLFLGSYVIVKEYKPEPPSAIQYEKYKNSSLYGIWIDEKRVSNEVLNKYSYTDFANHFASKLYGKAKEGRKYSIQIDLETKKYFNIRQNKKSDAHFWFHVNEKTNRNNYLR